MNIYSHLNLVLPLLGVIPDQVIFPSLMSLNSICKLYLRSWSFLLSPDSYTQLSTQHFHLYVSQTLSLKPNLLHPNPVHLMNGDSSVAQSTKLEVHP